MLDPFSCLAIAGAVCQFLDFGTKLTKETYALYEDGESTIRAKAAASTNELQDFSTRLGKILQRESTSDGLSEDEKVLQFLCLDCKNLADSLVAKLDTLNVKEKNRLWKSLGTALSNVLSKKDIEKTQEDLERYRHAIDTRMISLTRSAVNCLASEQSTRFKSLDQETQKIVASLANLKSSLESDLRLQRFALAQLLSRQEIVVRMMKNQATIQACDNSKQEQQRLRKAISSAILESLSFSTISQRFDDVAEAHHDTFQWIFQHPHEDLQGRQWDDFVEWLEHGDGLYWINSKASSGKSTLLKLVSGHSLTAKYLSTWTGQHDLFKASFFFWNSGTSLQKSQEGMLRSLLHDILLKAPQLISAVFPTQWAEMYLQKLSLPDSKLRYSWTLSNLMEAFEYLLDQKDASMRLCFFVDGLDEYSGLSSQIANLFQKAAKVSQVKICVSSRPHPVFKESFEFQPQLRLEDLTTGDIKNYVVDMLENDEKMQRRICNEQTQMRELVDEIVQSASGVFLWVKLIVMDLLRGLENHDRIALLQERLRDLPTDLEELYEHMVFKVNKIYRVKASRFYQLVAAASEQEDDWDRGSLLTLLDLYLAEEEIDLALNAEPGFLQKETLLNGVRETDLRLRSRCGGLLETQFGKSPLKDIQPGMPVSYIHRTVRDYLDGTGIRHILSDRTGGLSPGSFNANIALMRTYLLKLLIIEPNRENYLAGKECINAFIIHARRADWDLGETQADLIEKFCHCSCTWLNATGVERKDFSLFGTDTRTFTVRTGLHNCLRDQFSTEAAKPSRQLLNLALHPISRGDRFVNKDVISLLLEFEADPNEQPSQKLERREENQSPWQNSITYLATRFQVVPEVRRKILLMRWAAIIKMLLQNGAKANTVCAGPRNITRDEKTGAPIETETTTTPREVVEVLFAENPRELTGLLKLLDSKGADKTPKDDELDKVKNHILRRTVGTGTGARFDKEVGAWQASESEDMPRLVFAENLDKKAADAIEKNNVVKAHAKPGKIFRRGLKRLVSKKTK